MKDNLRELAEMVREAYRAGFIAACKWPAPVSQDVDSSAYNKEFNDWSFSVREKHAAIPARSGVVSDEDVTLLKGIETLCGSVENGSATVVKIFQNDVTRTWFFRVGDKYYLAPAFGAQFTLPFKENAMSAEYSVEEVREYIRDRVVGMPYKTVAMLTAYAERIEADESAVPWKSIDGAPRDGTVILLRWGEDAITPAWWNGDVPTPPDAPDDLCWSFIDAESAEFNRYFVNHGRDNKYGPSHWAPYSEKYFSHPPAQAAQVDADQPLIQFRKPKNAEEAKYLLELVLDQADRLNGKLKKFYGTTPTAEPVAQGEASLREREDVRALITAMADRIDALINGVSGKAFEYRNLSLANSDGEQTWLPWQKFDPKMQIRCLATQPHSPDAADAGAVSDEPIGWVFQHDETGRMCFCENDGINTPDVFAKNNPRHLLVSPAYADRHARQVPELSKEQVIALLTVACREMDKINSAIRAMIPATPPAPEKD